MFTARYGLIPYIEQIAFRLLKVKSLVRAGQFDDWLAFICVTETGNTRMGCVTVWASGAFHGIFYGVENVTCVCFTEWRPNIAILKIRDNAVLTGNLLPTFRKRLVPPSNLQFCNARQHCEKHQISHVLKPICIRCDPASNIIPQTGYPAAAATCTQISE